MAVQYHVSHSASTAGAASFAGGPFWCAEDNVEIALHACMVEPQNINTPALNFFTQQAANVLSIDSLANLKSAKVFIYSGTKDTVVIPGVAPKLAEYYKKYVPAASIKEVLNVSSEHAMPTNNGFGNPCGFKGTPYINQCGYDGAFEALSHLLDGPLTRGVPSDAKQQNLKPFDQTGFVVTGLPKAVGLGTKGYVYIPDACNQSTPSHCRLHVVFHGCEQGEYLLDDTYAWNAGYNAHAEVNGIVVLYPQAYSIPELNPKGCWDWWGFTGPDYACSLGIQVATVHKMVMALQRPPKSSLNKENTTS
eukprot:m.235657 g.235657  ORF g.235657 m.235657 type:complete len:306 (-) comp15762_c1_seq1:8-925(-)